MRAYQVYENPEMLKVATQVWEYARNYTISTADVSAGSMPTKSFNVSKICSGAALSGGTFWTNDVNDAILYGEITAAFFTLSAYLLQATSNNTYLSAAQDSGAFMIDIMDVTGEGNGLAAISANHSDMCGDIWGPGIHQIDQAGIFMEGLAVLPGNATFGQQNLSVNSLRSNLVNVTLATNPLCNAPNGIIDVGNGEGNSYLVQGLGSLYHVMQEPVDLIMYIGSFLSVQYNTIANAATDPGSNIYAHSWIGPPAPYDQSNQTQALFGLVNGAQVIFANTSNNRTSPGSSSSSGSHTQPKSLAGLIAGGVVGGVLLLAAIGLMLFLKTQCRQQCEKSLEFSIDALEAPQSDPTLPATETSLYFDTEGSNAEGPSSLVTSQRWSSSYGSTRKSSVTVDASTLIMTDYKCMDLK